MKFWTDNLICTHPFDFKICVVVDYGSGKRCMFFGSDITTHAICKSFIMIMGEWIDNLIFTHPFDFKIYVVVDYGWRKR